MTDDNPTIPIVDDDTPDEPLGLAVDRKIILALVALGMTALLLGLLRGRQKRQATAVQDEWTPENPGLVDGDWQASLEHLAAAWELRIAGIESRLDDAAAAKVAHAAATSMVPTPLVSPGSDDHVTIPIVEGADQGPPPAPAAVSVMDDADAD